MELTNEVEQIELVAVDVSNELDCMELWDKCNPGKSRKFLFNKHDFPNTEGIAVMIDGNIIGFMLAETRTDDIRIHDIVVDPYWRRQGIGSLLSDIPKDTVDAGEKLIVSVIVHENELLAQLFLKDNEFICVLEIKEYYTDGCSGLQFNYTSTDQNGPKREKVGFFQSVWDLWI